MGTLTECTQLLQEQKGEAAHSPANLDLKQT